MDNNAIRDEQTNFMNSFDMSQFAGHQNLNFTDVGMGGMQLDASHQHQHQHQQHELQQGMQGGDDQNPLDMDALQKMFGFVNDTDDNRTTVDDSVQTPKQSGSMQMGSHPTSASSSSSSTIVTNDLINQIKMQQFTQLQQMQNQIIHHQMELLKLSQSLQQATATATNEVNTQHMPGMHFSHGLPTPMNSHNLQAQVHPDIQQTPLVSPMIPIVEDSIFGSPQIPTPSSSSTQTSPNLYPQAHVTMSAPARIAFPHPPGMMPSPDYDLSPIPSPWLGPTGSNMHMPPPPQLSFGESLPRKRSSHTLEEDDSNSSRKRYSHQSHSSLGGGRSQTIDGLSTSLSSAHKRRRSLLSATGLAPAISYPADTPSPVDLTMPPPTSQPHASNNKTSPTGGSKSSSSPPNPITPDIEPVTPGSIMGMVPGTGNDAQPTTASRTRAGKTKSSLKLNTAGASTSTGASSRTPTTPRSSTRRGSKATTLKTILPDGTPPTPDMLASIPFSITPAASTGEEADSLSALPPRKTSHKAAEQKRRDSLKTTFDDLRLLLPPIPLPNAEENAVSEPLLPGALPPRGPPKGEPDGPNRHVSKLQLLRSGNEFIRALKGRVERRDVEIERLRAEIRRLYVNLGVGGGGLGFGLGMDGMDGLQSGEEPIDLEKDLDAVEKEMERMKRARGRVEVDDDDGDDD